MVNKTRCTKKLVLLFAISSLFACSTPKPVPPPNPYHIAYPNQFTAEPPSARWRLMNNSRDLNLFNSKLINLYYKKDTGSVLLVRFGREVDFGSSPSYDLTKGQLIYLIKMLSKGDFIKRDEYESKNPLLEKAKSIVRFKVTHPLFGPGQITATVLKRGDLLLVELFAPEKHIAEDEPEFFIFLDSLKENKPEDNEEGESE